MTKTLVFLPLAAVALSLSACSSETTNVNATVTNETATDLNSFDDSALPLDNGLDNAANASDLGAEVVNNG
ncbi:hypothetical protein [uncultured Sphingomonas sp.]|uniref:hypothetical protein n=1 Tax=uncultured Sphingomonas sp. TaxID=158754 RepID=UPI0025CE7B1F|nr:hypothetical protein [uncultured Sphingomonas sp.]